MINCEQLTGVVTDYMEGRLGLRLRFEMVMHMAMCPPCRAYVQQMRLTARLAAAAPVEPADAAVAAKVEQALRPGGGDG
ncbi:MAG: zf-HC2 domain-containing protein [Deltaproteobacteria bacterium]|nr:zf-HC2 domain-containing protein [Deltaproteobacteria bacterium]